jgi:DNA-nicking Smr family endonuclease
VARRLGAEERALWQKVIATVRPLHPQLADAEPKPPADADASPGKPRPKPIQPSRAPSAPIKSAVGETLDASWDRRLSRGLVAPDLSVDLHGHSLDSAYRLLDDSLQRAVARGARLLLLVTGKPPSGEPPVARGKIRAAVGDWLAASRHAADIAAVRNAHPRHGGAGALYIVLRRRR